MAVMTTRRVVLGIGAGVAAYKVPEVCRRLREHACDVTVVPTQASGKFVGAATWEALSGHAVSADVFSDVDQVRHVRLGADADLIVVAPATADLLARAASGRADDLLTGTLLMATCPVLFVPAMHTQMWRHPATQANVATLRARGAIVKEPASGRLTGADSGPGRMPEPGEIVEIALGLLDSETLAPRAAERDLAGMRVLVTAGGTREALDPVRYLGNASSGKMGIALATVAALRGADVTLVAANVEVDMPSAVSVRHVVSTQDMADAVLGSDGLGSGADIVVMAAAPADFAPVEASDVKIKKVSDEGLTLRLRQTTDILKTLSSRPEPGRVVVGFAAETARDADELLELGKAKLIRKGCDLLVLNDVSGGEIFGSSETAVTIIDHERILAQTSGTKFAVSTAIIDEATRLRSRRIVADNCL